MSDYYFRANDPTTADMPPSGGGGGEPIGYEYTNTYYDDGKTVTEYYTHAGGFVAATYEYAGGGGSWFATDGRSGTWGGSTSYWSIGGSLGIGFGLWGTGNGDWGIAWNAGIGAYALAGDAESAGAAIATVTDETAGIYFDYSGAVEFVEIDLQTGKVTFDEIGFNLGAYATSPDYNVFSSNLTGPSSIEVNQRLALLFDLTENPESIWPVFV